MSATASTGVDAIKRTRLDEVALGMTLLGLIVSSILYGISLTQAYKYFHRFKKDPLSIKFLVTAVIVLNTVSVFLVGHASWYYLVTKAPRRISVWSLNVELALSMVISGISETFLAFRVWKLSGKNYLLTGILLTFALLHFVSGEVSAVQFLLLKSFAKFGSVKVPSILRLTSAALCDTGIAVSLSYFLQQKRTGFKRSDEVIDYLIIFSINSGLLTSVSSIACLITYLVVPRTWVYLALCFLISRLYANTFLCSLNSRQILRNSEIREVVAPGASVFRPRRIRSVLRRSDGEKTPTQIDVYVVTETISDGPQLMSSEPKTISDSHQKSLENHSDSNSSLGESATSSFSNQ